MAGPLLALALLASGCTTDKLGTGARCARNSECAAPLVCRLDRCRRECNTTRDCPVGLACVLDGQGLGACQVPEDMSCRRPSDCASPLVCRFQQCVNACNDSRDCPAGSSCQTDSDGNRACIDPSGKACVYHEECAPTGQTCALDGRCREECVNDRDCRYGSFCCGMTHVCLEAGQEAACMMMAPRDMGPADSGGVGPARDAGPADGGGGPVPGLPPASIDSLACRGDSTCVGTDLGAYCFGRNDHGQLGTGAASAGEPLPLAVASPGAESLLYQSIACDAEACCAQGNGSSGARVYCWGRFADFDTGTVTDHLVPVDVPGIPADQFGGVVSVAAGTFAVSFSRNLSDPPGWTYGAWLWGDNSYGQLADGTTMPSATPTRTALAGSPPEGSAGVQLGDGFGCAAYPSLMSSGVQVYCWGRNDRGQLGLGTTSPTEAVPRMAMVPGSYSQLRLGSAHGCFGGNGVGSSADLRCWGRGDLGQIGDGANVDQPSPVVTLAAGAYSIIHSCGGDACCATRPTMTHDLVCWGRGPGISASTPTPITPPPGVDPGTTFPTSLCVGTSHACVAVRAMGGGPDRLFCWGDNTYGQLGDGTMGGSSDTPVEVVHAP